MKKVKIKTKQLIEAVKQRAPLWDRHHEMRLDRGINQMLWEEVAVIIGESGKATRNIIYKYRHHNIRCLFRVSRIAFFAPRMLSTRLATFISASCVDLQCFLFSCRIFTTFSIFRRDSFISLGSGVPQQKNY